MTRQQVEALFARRETALNQRDVAAISSLYADDVVVESPMAGGAVQGRTAADEVNRAFIAGFPDVSFTRDALVVDGDRVVWIGEVRGTDTGGFMGLAATGKPFRLRDADSNRCAEGEADVSLRPSRRSRSSPRASAPFHA